MRQPGLFDMDERLRRLSAIGDQLEAFGRVADFEMFRPELDAALAYGDGSKGGRPPLDPVMMFKVLVIQATNNLSDDRTEFLINDRLSFMRFLGLGLSDRVPDAKTIWSFRERLTKAGAIKALFARFDAAIRSAGYVPMSGRIVDASHGLGAASTQHRDRESGDQGRARPARVAGQAGEAAPERPRRALDAGLRQGAAARGRHAPRRHRHPGLRLQEPRGDRPAPWLHPDLGGHRREQPRRPHAAPGSA